MKKTLAVILALVMCCFAFAACTKNEVADSGNVSGAADNADANNAADESGENADSADAASDLAYVTEKGTLVIGITDYAPMNYKDENGEWTGFDTEFAQIVAEKLGVTAEFIEIDWDSKTLELESKAIDCVWNGMTLTEEVQASMSCSVPYVINAQVVVMDKDKAAEYDTPESFADLTFVAEAGSAGAEALDNIGYEYTEVQTQADALMEVSAGAEDACVIDITMANAMTGEGTGYANLAASYALTEEEYGIGFRKSSDLTEKVNEIIAELMQDGTLPALAEKYDLTLAE